MYLPKTEYYELPNKYNKTIVRLLVQSPTRMYVYWEVDDDSIKYFESKKSDYSSARPVLKIKNLTMNYSYDIAIDPFTTNYYIDVKDPDCEYQVELGRVQNDEFVNLYTSNSAKIPRSNPVYVGDSEEVIYKNYIRLDMTDKFTIYHNKRNYNIDGSNPQDYTKLSLSTDFFTGANEQGTIINEGSFSRYENGISSMENISSFNKYEDNISSYSRYDEIK